MCLLGKTVEANWVPGTRESQCHLESFMSLTNIMKCGKMSTRGRKYLSYKCCDRIINVSVVFIVLEDFVQTA